MQYGGCAHANCNDGYMPSKYEDDIEIFIKRVRT